MPRTLNDVLVSSTQDYLDKIDMTNPPSPRQLEDELLYEIELQLTTENACRQKGNLFKIPQHLNNYQIMLILKHLYPIYNICTGGEDANEENDLLAVYNFNGEDEGIYTTSPSNLRRLAQQFNDGALSTRDMNEITTLLQTYVPRKTRCTKPNLIAVNNGIFDYDTKQLLPFSPDLIFLAKSKVDYNPNAVNSVIHNDEDNTDWDVETWMNELSDDPEIVNLLWEILGAIIRPNVPWGKSAWFYSEKGNNGKGTLCELMRNLVGRGSYASLSLNDMSKDFMLSQLTRTTCIITDENDVGTFIDKAANLKTIVTGDTLLINRKYKEAIAYQFKGFMVQCLNELPRVKDKSDSFYRRQLFVPFTKCFTGIERKYIKNDYLSRKNVLEYVLQKVLNTNYYKLSEPTACKAVLEEYKEYNDPVRQFVNEILPQAMWDFLPFQFLYDMYCKWYEHNMPSGKPQNRPSFTNDILIAIDDNDEWYCDDKKKTYYVGHKMDCCEPLIGIYDLKDWMNPKLAHMGSASMVDKCTPMQGQYSKKVTRGLLRKNASSNNTANIDDNN